jgi:prepilin-type N-terminal cleavage/methylation domain-containing protein
MRVLNKKQFEGHGFTLIEMLVVLGISLMLMVLVVPVFQVTTKTVQAVERKLSVYEAARNILDIIESDVKLGVVNERGGHWSLKSVAWEDNDAFTPPGSALIPGNTDKASMAYKQSRRFADSVNYVRLEGAGNASNEDAAGKLLSRFPGGKAFPLSYYPNDNNYPEMWRSSLRTSLLYQNMAEAASGGDEMFDNGGARWTRNEQLADVSTIETTFVFYSVLDQFRWWNTGPYYTTRHYDQVPDPIGPGKELKVVPAYHGNQGFLVMRRITGIRVLDLDVAYWDETQAKFVDPPDNTVIYFWPAPKAIRITITVCDAEKRSMLTLSRVVHIPIGFNNSTVTNALDSSYTAPAVFNRTKYMPKLPSVYDGLESANNKADWESVNETKLLTNYQKPIGWP